MRIIRLVLALAIAAVLLALSPVYASDDRLLVFGASSLTEALTDAGKAYARTGRPVPTFSFAASSALARQVENGAPAALFIAADEEWMDYLQLRRLIRPD